MYFNQLLLHKKIKQMGDIIDHPPTEENKNTLILLASGPWMDSKFSPHNWILNGYLWHKKWMTSLWSTSLSSPHLRSWAELEWNERKNSLLKEISAVFFLSFTLPFHSTLSLSPPLTVVCFLFLPSLTILLLFSLLHSSPPVSPILVSSLFYNIEMTSHGILI